MNNFTPRAQQVMTLAKKEADRFNHNYIGTEHLLLGLIKLGQGIAVNVLQKMGLDLASVRNAVEKQVGSGSGTVPTGTLPYTPRVKKVLALAGKEARALNHAYIGTEHILLGLLREGEGVAARVLKSLNLNIEECRNEILAELDPHFSSQNPPPTPSTPGDSGHSMHHPMGEQARGDIKTPALKAFGRNLTEQARAGKLDPVIGRHQEIKRIIQVLCRRTKNNPVLIGEAGVGKTAIMEGLAQEIADGQIPEILADKQIITLDLALMVAGTKYRGQFEERLKAVMDEIRKVKNVIIFIDELHTIVGVGAAEGAMDASNILKPALSRGELQCIGATTLAEYRKFIEKDTALERRFQPVKVDPPSVDETILILKGIRKRYEAHHHVEYSDGALEAAARLADRYITGRHLPDKAIDVLDEAGARGRIQTMKRPTHIDEVKQKREVVTRQKESAIAKQHFEEAAEFRDKEKKLDEKIEELNKAWKAEREEAKVKIGTDDMYRIVADSTGIPLHRMEEAESKKLLEMEADLQKQVIGQDEATKAIARALRRSRADLKDPRRPIGSFLFLGPTGVGKTHLARMLSIRMFGSQDAMIQIDMSEYMEKHAVSRLVGSPPGYIGHEEGGQLTEAVRRKPYSLVLFDEIEKAHPDVTQLLLQVLEEGRLTDSLGRVVDFRNTIIIMTSNVGAERLQKDTGLGFGHGISEEQDYESLKDKVMEETKKFFKPEFLNRISDIVIFHSLSKKHMHAIVEIEVKKVIDRLLDKGIDLTLDESVFQLLIERGYDEKFGARPLRRAVERYLEDPLAEAILGGELKHGKVTASVKDGQTVFEGGKAKAKPKAAAKKKPEAEAKP